MTFPTVNFKTTNVQIEDRLLDLLEGKLQSLNKYLGIETNVVCEAEFEKLTASEKGPVHRVEVNLQVGGELYRAEATEESFEKAIDEVRDELDKELRRSNRKRDSMLKKGGRKIKEMIRFGK